MEKDLEKINIGDKAEFTKTISETDIYLYAGITGDFNPVHINKEYSKTTIFKERVAHGMLSAGLISTVLGNQLPGPGAIYLSQVLNFVAPVKIGDTVTAEVEVIGKDLQRRIVRLKTVCRNQEGVPVINGEASVMLRK